MPVGAAKSATRSRVAMALTIPTSLGAACLDDDEDGGMNVLLLRGSGAGGGDGGEDTFDAGGGGDVLLLSVFVEFFLGHSSSPGEHL